MSTDHLVRIEKGRAEPEELAAVTAVLLARAAAAGRPAETYHRPRSTAAWRRMERQGSFRAPHSWQS